MGKTAIMNVTKGVSAPRKEQTYLPDALARLIFFCTIFMLCGWMGCDFLPPSIFLIFKYDNKQDVLIPKMGLKVAYVF